MSRIGKRPIEVPGSVKVHQDAANIRVEGPKGFLQLALPQGVELTLQDKTIHVTRISDSRKARSYHGLVRTLVANMVTGVSAGFEKNLEISGVGYRAEAGDGILKLALGYSRPIEYRIPEGIDIKVDKQVNITVAGIDRQLVGRVAAEIRSLRKPEPYKGKGIKYAGERIRRKVGKSVGA
ncbi:MAG: 50S ribosomal protein L6 [Deltaproteobacteria bacterium]|nr:50S ribosomal protein L6 [Deltaproteobacteria bacterium]